MSPEVMTFFLAMLSIRAALCPAPRWLIAGATFGLASINVLYLSAVTQLRLEYLTVPGVLELFMP